MGWITAVLASDLARKALGLLLASFTIILFLLNLRCTGERTGRLAERLQSTEQAHDIQRRCWTPPRVALGMPSSQRKNSVACGSMASMVRLVSLGMGDPAR